LFANFLKIQNMAAEGQRSSINSTYLDLLQKVEGRSLEAYHPENTIYVYTLKCNATGTVYIGKSKDPWKAVEAFKKNPPLAMSADMADFQPFKEYFELQVLVECGSAEETAQVECYFITQRYRAGIAFPIREPLKDN
jgi:predicted GIY-YIG superfamily endonuclease